MIPEMNRKQKSLIFICIAISLLLHIMLIVINIILNKGAPRTAKQSQTPKQTTMTIMKPTRRIHRAGTGKQAPQTTKVLTPTPQPARPVRPPRSTRQPQQAPEQSDKKTSAKKKQPKKQKRTFTSPTGRIPMQQFFQDALDEQQVKDETIETKKVLSFLSPQHLYQAMRQNAMNTQSDGTTTQYGDLKYLHYNRKVYQALQQSMNLMVSRLSREQYKMALEDIQHPTRIRFALDQDGKLAGLTVVLSSGNYRYDALAYQIIQEASYPPIPKSFNMHTTYHTYGIILYYDGAPHDRIGVSPYLEGE